MHINAINVVIYVHLLVFCVYMHLSKICTELGETLQALWYIVVRVYIGPKYALINIHIILKSKLNTKYIDVFCVYFMLLQFWFVKILNF